MNRKECVSLGETLSTLKPVEIQGKAIIKWIKTKKYIDEETATTRSLISALIKTYNIILKEGSFSEIDLKKTNKEDLVNYIIAERELLADKVELPEYVQCLTEDQFIKMYERVIEDVDNNILDLIYEYFVEKK